MTKILLTSQEFDRLYYMGLNMAHEIGFKYFTVDMMAYNFIRFLSDKYISDDDRERCMAELECLIRTVPVGLVEESNAFADVEVVIRQSLMSINVDKIQRYEVAHFISTMFSMQDCCAIYLMHRYVDFNSYFKDTCSEDMLVEIENCASGKLVNENINVQLEICYTESIVDAHVEQCRYESESKEEALSKEVIASFGEKFAKYSILTRELYNKYRVDKNVPYKSFSHVANILSTRLNLITKTTIIGVILSKYNFGTIKNTGHLDGDFDDAEIFDTAIRKANKVLPEKAEMANSVVKNFIEVCKRMALTSETVGTVYEDIAKLNKEQMRYLLDTIFRLGCNFDGMYYILSDYLDDGSDDNTDAIEDNNKRGVLMPDEEFVKLYSPCISENVEYMTKKFTGREKEIDNTCNILCKKFKHNVLYVGESGVGKTAMVVGLCKRLIDGDRPDRLGYIRVFRLDTISLVAGCTYRGELEVRVGKLLKYWTSISKDGNTTIVFIDDIHSIFKISGESGNLYQMLRKAISGNDITFIGATSKDMYNQVCNRVPEFNRCFNVIEIKEPSKEECFDIIRGYKDELNSSFAVNIPDETIEKVIDLSIKNMKTKFLPDKAIDLLDEACAYVHMYTDKTKDRVITSNIVEEIIAKKCGVPVESVSETEADRIMRLESELEKHVFGQSDACKIVDTCIKVSRSGLSSDENKPIASLLFVGPTGVGKTELAKVVANTLDIPLIRFDMSEYKESYSTSKFIGSAPGYVGYEEGGLFVRKVVENPYSVVLLDEIEKANNNIFDLLLQVMDNAELTDSLGQKADFRNVILIMTSNAGAKEIGTRKLGFSTVENNVVGNEAIDNAVSDTFKPEFLNRLTEVVKFNFLNKDVGRKIAERKISELKSKLEKKNIALNVSDDCISYIVNKGVDNKYGAREISRIIDKEIKSEIANMMFSNVLSKSGNISIDYEDNALKFSSEKF